MTIAHEDPASPDAFWEFAAGLYGSSGVAAQLLAWQDRQGANINMVLLCAWAGRHGRHLTPDDIARALAAAAGWRGAVIQPLRALRRRLKADWRSLAPDPEPARQAILAAELAAERTEQGLLLAALAPWPKAATRATATGETDTGSAALVRANLAAYLGDAVSAAPAASIAWISVSE
jgi:uncharacterized protein (TIGR02444 family)